MTGVGIAPPAAPAAEALVGFTGADADAGAAVQVDVSAEAGTAVTVVCQDGAAGRVAVVLAGGVWVLIDEVLGAGPGEPHRGRGRLPSGCGWCAGVLAG